MEVKGRGKELEELSVGGRLMGCDPSRSGAQGLVGGRIAKRSRFLSNEIRLQALRTEQPGAPFPPPLLPTFSESAGPRPHHGRTWQELDPGVRERRGQRPGNLGSTANGGSCGFPGASLRSKGKSRPAEAASGRPGSEHRPEPAFFPLLRAKPPTFFRSVGHCRSSALRGPAPRAPCSALVLPPEFSCPGS